MKDERNDSNRHEVGKPWALDFLKAECFGLDYGVFARVLPIF